MNEFAAFWKNYVNFSGRTSVKGYWMATLFNIIIAVVLSILTQFVSFFGILSGLYSLAILIPSLAICVRRFHDINKAGWWVFLNLVPFIGSIIVLVMFCKASVDEGNRFGTEQV